MSSYTGFGDRLATRVNTRIGRWQDSARRARAGINAPTPPIRVDTGPAAPDWLFRLACTGFGILAIIALAPGVVATVILSGLLLLVLIRPAAGTAAIFCGAVGLFWTLDPSPPNSLSQVAILASAAALWTMAGVITDLPLRTRIEFAVLRVPAIRFLVLQLIGQSILFGAELLQAHRSQLSPMIVGAVVLALGVIMAVGAWLLLPRLPRDPADPGW